MNWGYKILFVYIIFVLGIVFMVYKSSIQNQDLVTKDYYEQELKYQEKIDAKHRANALHTNIKYKISQEEIEIGFPDEMKGKNIQATILLYCPSEKSKDIERKVSTEEAVIHFPFPAQNKGNHELKILWIADKTSYYFEEKIMIP